VIQDLALRYPDWVDRMVLFNSPLPYLKEAMAGTAFIGWRISRSVRARDRQQNA
jgi:hypothetical protein